MELPLASFGRQVPASRPSCLLHLLLDDFNYRFGNHVWHLVVPHMTVQVQLSMYELSKSFFLTNSVFEYFVLPSWPLWIPFLFLCVAYELQSCHIARHLSDTLGREGVHERKAVRGKEGGGETPMTILACSNPLPPDPPPGYPGYESIHWKDKQVMYPPHAPIHLAWQSRRTRPRHLLPPQTTRNTNI